MIQGSWLNAVVTIATSTTLSAEVDLGRQYETLLITMPTLGTGATAVSFQGARLSGGTFQDLYTTDPEDGNNHQVISATFTTAVFGWVVPIGGFRYIKVKCSGAQAANRTFRVCGVRR